MEGLFQKQIIVLVSKFLKYINVIDIINHKDGEIAETSAFKIMCLEPFETTAIRSLRSGLEASLKAQHVASQRFRKMSRTKLVAIDHS